MRNWRFSAPARARGRLWWRSSPLVLDNIQITIGTYQTRLLLALGRLLLWPRDPRLEATRSPPKRAPPLQSTCPACFPVAAPAQFDSWSECLEEVGYSMSTLTFFHHPAGEPRVVFPVIESPFPLFRSFVMFCIPVIQSLLITNIRSSRSHLSNGKRRWCGHSRRLDDMSCLRCGLWVEEWWRSLMYD